MVEKRIEWWRAINTITATQFYGTRYKRFLRFVSSNKSNLSKKNNEKYNEFFQNWLILCINFNENVSSGGWWNNSGWNIRKIGIENKWAIYLSKLYWDFQCIVW